MIFVETEEHSDGDTVLFAFNEGLFQSGHPNRSTGSARIKHESEHKQIRLLVVLFGHSDMQLVSEHLRSHRAGSLTSEPSPTISS